MSKDSPTPPPQSSPLNEGYQPMNKGHQPIAITPHNPGQAGHQPSTGQGGSGPGTPPSQGGSGKK